MNDSVLASPDTPGCGSAWETPASYDASTIRKYRTHLPENIEHRLARLIELDLESRSGLYSAGLALFERAKSSIPKEVFDLLVADELSENKLITLLAGGTWVAAALSLFLRIYWHRLLEDNVS